MPVMTAFNPRNSADGISVISAFAKVSVCSYV